MNYVYFVRQGDAVKIGRTRSLVARLASLGTANSEPVDLMAAVLAPPQYEIELHERFRHLWIRGEWFRLAPELSAFIEGIGRSNAVTSVPKRRSYSRLFKVRDVGQVGRCSVTIDASDGVVDPFRDKVKALGLTQRTLLLRWIRNFTEGRRPDEDDSVTKGDQIT